MNTNERMSESDFLEEELELLIRWRNTMLKSSKNAGLLFIPEELLGPESSNLLDPATVPIVVGPSPDVMSQIKLIKTDYTSAIAEVEERMKKTEHRLAVLYCS